MIRNLTETTPQVMRSLFLIFSLVLSLNYSIGQVIRIGDTGDYPNLEAAANVISGGDTLLLESQVFDDGSQFLYDLIGTQNQPIVILAQEMHQAIFQGGTESIHLVRCHYVEINGIVVQGQSGNGMNIDDGGDFSVPSKHITIRNCIFQDMAASGNNDLLKMSGVDSFLIENCTFLNGGAGGSGVDFVGCHYGTVQDCLFDNAGTSGIQNKGGTQHIRIQRNYFTNISQRALNLGGSTGLQFFRPPLTDPIENAFEAADIEVYSNIFHGCWAPIAYVGAVRVKVVNNTFYKPENWVIRILQETTEPGFLTCAENEFSNNIIYLPEDLTEVNIGPNTDPASFILTNNLWFNEADANWAPTLPVNDMDQIIDDPNFVDQAANDFKLQNTSPAIANGLSLVGPITDYENFIYNTPPSIGAYEGNPLSRLNEIKTGFKVKIYPNPTSNLVTLSSAVLLRRVTIYNAIGVQMETHSMSEVLKLNTSDWPVGIYYISCTSNDNDNQIFKLIKN